MEWRQQRLRLNPWRIARELLLRASIIGKRKLSKMRGHGTTPYGRTVQAINPQIANETAKRVWCFHSMLALADFQVCGGMVDDGILQTQLITTQLGTAQLYTSSTRHVTTCYSTTRYGHNWTRHSSICQNSTRHNSTQTTWP